MISTNWERSQSTILKALETKCNESNKQEIKALATLIDFIETPIEKHLSCVSNQLPDFDIHDISHCHKLIENIEKLLIAEQLQNLDPFELFLIYTSCLLHDTAMALPQWEYTLLKWCEGQEEFNINNSPDEFMFDEKPTPSYSFMLDLIKANKNELYKFDEVKDFVFCHDSEEDLLSDLADRAIAYIKYRNGFESLHIMRENGNQAEYKNVSEDIRCHFIRDTHHEHVENYIKVLKSMFAKHFDGVWAKSLVDDLGFICRSHGEPFDFVQTLKTKSIYFQGHAANLQFIATLLRLSDILHFSYDRAPLSLFAEKQIVDRESRKHWLTKLQGVSYEIRTDNDLRTIVYSAYCEDPDSLYFLRDYIKLIEIEIQNYNKFYRENQYPQYFLNIRDNVDSDGIKHNRDAFIPDDSLRFTLDQSRVLELLMGVNLYKDKYLCLRELYQNSLDACRVMRGFNPNEEGKIEFGIGSEKKDGKECRYVYCLDNGSGMDKEIITNHFLRIGNSYYNSPSFRRLNLSAKERFSPVSQFGIGVLSCFMIGDTLDITTQSMKGEVTRFIVNGQNERFYYVKPGKKDLDLLAGHGTLVKVFLKPDEKLNDEYPGDKEFLQAFYKNNHPWVNDSNREYFDLFNILQLYIFHVPEKINLSIKTNCGYKKLWDVTTQISDIYNCDGEITFWGLMGYNMSQPEIGELENLDLHKIKVEHNGIIYYNHLVLPKKQCEGVSEHQIYKVRNKLLNPFTLLNDGIVVNEYNIFWNYVEKGGSHSYTQPCFCFNSDQHLTLSVDRINVINIPEKIKSDVDELLIKIAIFEIDYIWQYLRDTDIPWDSDLANNIWASYFDLQEWNFTRILDAILKSKARIYIEKICSLIGTTSSLDQIMKLKSTRFKNIHLRRETSFYTHPPIERFISLLFWQTCKATAKEDAIEVEFTEPDYLLKNIPDDYDINKNGFYPIVKLEYYAGKYMEYDFVNSFFPFVPQYLFDRIIISVHTYKLYLDNNRRKIIITDFDVRYFFEILTSVTVQSVYPEKALYDGREITNKLASKIGHRIPFDRNFYGREIPFVFSQQETSKKEMTIFYCYFCPGNLTKEDEKQIEYYKSENPKYVEGILKGWSVLILGEIDQVIVEPGIVRKSTMLKKIGSSFWEQNSDALFYFPDGTHVTKEYIDTLTDG